MKERGGVRSKSRWRSLWDTDWNRVCQKTDSHRAIQVSFWLCDTYFHKKAICSVKVLSLFCFCDKFDLSACSMNCFRCWIIEVLPRWRPGQETERWDPLGLESPNIGGWCSLARAEVDGSDELWLRPQPVALSCLQPPRAAVLLSARCWHINRSSKQHQSSKMY